ncbi:MAG TPA: hypothetical protein VHM90_07020, partial [Phycisphaerae bacterium]|nr:hypothetical protein [Phycisphaerae bacterium]
PVQDVLKLATNAGSKHETLIDKPGVGNDTDRRIAIFLVKSTNWKGPKARGTEQIQRLLQNQLK